MSDSPPEPSGGGLTTTLPVMIDVDHEHAHKSKTLSNLMTGFLHTQRVVSQASRLTTRKKKALKGIQRELNTKVT